MKRLKVTSALSLTCFIMACGGGGASINHDTSLLPVQFSEIERSDLTELEKQGIIVKNDSIESSRVKINSKLSKGMTNSKHLKMSVDSKSAQTTIKAEILDVKSDSFKTRYTISDNTLILKYSMAKNLTVKLKKKQKKQYLTVVHTPIKQLCAEIAMVKI